MKEKKEKVQKEKLPKEKSQKEKKALIKKKEEKSSNEMIKKAVSRTSYLIIMVVIIIAAYIGIDLIMDKINPTDIDLTAEKIYSLSDSSKQIAKNIDKDVKIILVNSSNTQSVIDFSNRYNKENSKITVEQIDDITKYPELTKKYSLTSSNLAIIIECGDKSKVLSESDLYTFDYSTYEEKDLTEEVMTNALLDVTTENKPKVYFLTGNNTNLDTYMTSFRNKVQSQANEVETLDILTKGSVPDDCDVLVLTTLDEDLKTVERDAILAYIKKGGKIALFTDSNVTNTKMPNFQQVLDEYGISISSGIMLEGDSNKMLAGSPSAIVVTIESETSITKNLNMATSACFINSGRIEIKDSDELEKLGVDVETLAVTSDKSFYRSDLNISSTSKQSGDEEGSATVGALLTKKIDDNTTSKLIVYSNNMFITDMQLSIGNNYLSAYQLYNNEDLALNSIAYLTDRDDTIMIRKNTETSTYTVTNSQQKIILTIIFAVPVLIIIAGIVVWQVRRRKK